MNSKDNPSDLTILCRILDLPEQIEIPRGTRKYNFPLYLKLKREQKLISQKRLTMLKPYLVGKYKEWEGDGYYISNLYLHNGTYYG